MGAGRRGDSRAELKPTAHQTFELEGRGACDFAAVLERSYRLQGEGRVEEACNERYAAVQRLMDILPEDEETIFEFGHRNSRAALELVQASGVDHFLAGDFEMAAALAELLLDLDPEDHLGVVVLAGFCYVALGEYDSFGDIECDIADSQPEKTILRLWSSFRRTGSLPPEDLRVLRERFTAVYEEFTSAEHPVDEEYLRDVESASPSRKTEARRLWLQTEHLWREEGEFIKQLGIFN